MNTLVIAAGDEYALRHKPLPDDVEMLVCTGYSVAELPVLPASLRWLECNNNPLKELPELPKGLQKLRCQECLLSSLPELPSELQDLRCDGNAFVSMPRLPEKLTHLHVDYCALRYVESLPASLVQLTHDYGLFRKPFLSPVLQPYHVRLAVGFSPDAVAEALRVGWFDKPTDRLALRELLNTGAAAALTRWHWMRDALHILGRKDREAAEAALAGIPDADAYFAL